MADASDKPLNIRPAGAGDIAAVRACAEAAYAIYFPRMDRTPAPVLADFACQADRGRVFVGVAAARIAGYIVLYPRGDHIHIENVAVYPEFQGRGIGRALLTFAERHAAAAGIAAIELYTNLAMTENLTFYPRLGYAETGRRTEDGFQRVYFRKSLTG